MSDESKDAGNREPTLKELMEARSRMSSPRLEYEKLIAIVRAAQHVTKDLHFVSKDKLVARCKTLEHALATLEDK